MAARTLEAPLDISLDDLQTGIQNEEDGGFVLVDLSKGSKGAPPALVPVNLAGFDPRTESLEDVQLVETPPNLFISNGAGAFTIDSAVEATFRQQMTNKGMDVSFFSPIVSINGKDTSLAVVRHTGTAPAPGGNNALQPAAGATPVGQPVAITSRIDGPDGG